MRSNDSGSQVLIVEDVEREKDSDDDHEEHLEQPWHFWKWLIPVYSAILCCSILLTLSFWVTVIQSSEFLIYIGDDNKVVWDLLPTLPTACMLIEFPFNMIPMDWPMLIFVEILFSFYLFVNFIIVSFEKDHTTIYEAWDWYHEPLTAFWVTLLSYVLLAGIFAVFWAIS